MGRKASPLLQRYKYSISKPQPCFFSRYYVHLSLYLDDLLVLSHVSAPSLSRTRLHFFQSSAPSFMGSQDTPRNR